MKKLILFGLLSFFSLPFFVVGQTLDQPANWPNTGWTLDGNYDAPSLLADPTVDANLSYDDDGAGSGSTADSISAESPVIDLSAAETAGETNLYLEYEYDFNSGDIFEFQYWDADAMAWVAWEALPDNSSATGSWCGELTGTTTLSAALDVSAFTATQLSGFQYRVLYDASSTWGWGFCMASPRIFSAADPVAPTIAQDATAPDCIDGTILDITSVAGTNEVYYWQTNGTATETTDPYTGQINVFANGWYYANTQNTTTGEWSTTDSIEVTNYPVVATPPAPTADLNPACYTTGSVLTADAAPAGYEYYWQETNEFGSASTLPATATYTASTSGTYYLASYETATECWSNPNASIDIVVSDFIPNAPTATEDTVFACSGAATIDMEVTATGSATYTYTIDMFDSFGDGWNGNTVDVFADGALIATLGGTFTGGSNTQETFTVDEGVELTTGVAEGGGFTYECSFDILDESMAVVGSGDDTSPITPYTVPVGAYDFVWYDAATGGTQLGTGATLNAVGTSVMPTAVEGEYEFYVSQGNGCESDRTQITVVVSNVNVELLGIDETCTDYQDGSIVISNVLCGVSPFQFSTDGGGTFTSDLSGLSAGTYNVIVQDDNGDQTTPITVVLDTASTVIPGAPQYIQEEYLACIGSGSIEIEVDGPVGPGSLFTTDAGGNGCGGGNMFDLTTNTNQVTVTSLDIIPNTTGAQDVNVYVKTTGGYAGSQTVPGDWTLIGTYPISGTTGTAVNIDVDDFTVPASTTHGVYVEYSAQYTTSSVGVTYSNTDLTLTVGDGLCSSFGGANAGRAFNGEVYYDATTPVDINWYDAASAGSLVGSDNPLETVGTSVLPTATEGTYDFYAFSQLGGCESATNILVQVTVAPVLVEITPIDVTCEGGADGSFVVSAVECGVAPFTYSMDGGTTFGPEPTDLAAGDHEVIVQDDNGDLSGSIPFTVGDGPAPTDLILDAYSNSDATISWTQNGSEASWNVEWGTPGFTPGAGEEEGSDVSGATTYDIMGLTGNTEYEVYVSSACGNPNEWISITFTTACDPIEALNYCEGFNSDSQNEACWSTLNANADGDEWDMNYTFNTFEGDEVAVMYTDFNGGNNDDYLISPLLTLSGNEIMNFNYRVQSSGEPNDFEVLLSTTGTNPADFTDTLMFLDSYNNTTYTDSTVDLSAYTGDVYIAFHVPSGGLDGWRLYIDEVCFQQCVPTASMDGEIDVCRLDSTVYLPDAITEGETYGNWYFDPNQSAINGDTMNVLGLPEGSFDITYIVEAGCTSDTAIGTLNIYGPSSAGEDGTIDACQNQLVELVGGLNGNVDHGGTWYDPSGVTISGTITTGTLQGQFNYDYVTSNGVCPNDTSNVIVTIGACDYLTIEELVFEGVNIYPNPTSGEVTISIEGEDTAFEYVVLDINGREVDSSKDEIIAGTKTVIDLSKFDDGIYMIKLSNEDAERMYRVVKN